MRDKRTELRKESYSFSDLVNIDTFSRLVDSFFKATGIPNGLVGPGGELIAQSGWIDACAKFHRANPESCRLCEESNLELIGKLRDGEVTSCLCKNGLYDYATPIVIEGRPLATLFLGQVLNTPPDLEFFRKQAAQFGFNEDTYLDAIRAAPIVSKEQMEAYMEYMVSVAQMLASMGLARLRETRLEYDLNRSTEQRIQMEDLLEFSPVGISWCDVDGKIEYINRQFTRLFGYTLEDLPDLDSWVHKAYPDEEYRKNVLEPWVHQADDSHKSGTLLPELESYITCKDGSQRRVVTRVSWVGDKRLANFTDITVRWKSEQRDRAHGVILEMIAKAEPLSKILHAIVQEIETVEPGAYGSVLLLDKEGKHLFTGAAPRLPSFYNEAIDGIEIGMGVGSCGTAAHLGERVIVEDIATHDYWRPYADLAKQAGLASCWSEPIIASGGKVLGTFAIYHDSPTAPTAENIQLITFAANLAAIAIENRNTRDALIRSEREFRTLAENAPINISRYDRDGRKIYVNQKLAATLALPVDQLLGKHFSEQPESPHIGIFQDAVMLAIKTGKSSTFEIEVSVAGGERETHYIRVVAERDESGAIISALATGLDITDRKRLEKELQRQAHLDFLTGLANRRYFIELAEIELLRINRYGGELSLILFDIDYFKRINDTHGHSNGDLVLQEVARISRETVREIDIVGRLGGEEFVVLLPQTSRLEAAEAAERMRIAIADGGVRLESGDQIRFTASFGVVTISSNRDPREEIYHIDELLKRADDAMYRAKDEGRNLVCLDDNC